MFREIPDDSAPQRLADEAQAVSSRGMRIRGRKAIVLLAGAALFAGSIAGPACAARAPISSSGRTPAGIVSLDLAGDTARHVVVDREAGQYLGHPTMVLLEDGRTIIAVYPKGHGAGAILMKRSSDGGKTWSGR